MLEGRKVTKKLESYLCLWYDQCRKQHGEVSGIADEKVVECRAIDFFEI